MTMILMIIIMMIMNAITMYLGLPYLEKAEKEVTLIMVGMTEGDSGDSSLSVPSASSSSLAV